MCLCMSPGVILKIMHVFFVFIHESCYIVDLHLEVQNLQESIKQFLFYNLEVTYFRGEKLLHIVASLIIILCTFHNTILDHT